MSSKGASGDDDGPTQSARERLIERAQLEAHVERDRVVRARSLFDGDVPREALVEYQDAILSYYWSMRPLRSEGVVADYWSSTVVSEAWRDDVDVETVPVVDAELDGPAPRVVDVDVERPAPVRGLDALAELPHQVESGEVEHSDMRGTRRRDVVRARVLDDVVLFDAHECLDDAAAKLGFAPSAPLVDADPEVV